MNLYPLTNYLSPIDLISALLWLMILFMLTYLNKNNDEPKLFRANFSFKIIFALFFAGYYIGILNGGDTLAYWDGAKVLANLFIESPTEYFTQLFSESSQLNYHYAYNQTTGYPPVWIYYEHESFLVSKITSIFALITFKSYLASTFIFAFLMANANWKIYQIAKQTNLFKTKLLKYVILFLPSVSFWCSGISKDTIVVISIYYLMYYLYRIFVLNERQKFRWWLGISIIFLTLMNTRSFMLAAIFLPFIIAVFNNLIQKSKQSPLFKFSLKIFGFSFIVGFLTMYIGNQTQSNLEDSNELLQNAVVIQQDFQNNATYGQNKYSLGEIEYTPIGILKTIPIAILSGVLQPYPWNALSFGLFLNGIESLLIMFFIYRLFIGGNRRTFIKKIRTNQILIFILTFVLIVALMAGFTSIIYGVLVRIRAPILPFVMTLLIINTNQDSKIQNKELT
jgi:hypothetical protein